MSLFVPRPYTKEQVTIRIDVEKLEQIDAFTRDYHISRSEFINQRVNYFVEYMRRRTAKHRRPLWFLRCFFTGALCAPSL